MTHLLNHLVKTMLIKQSKTKLMLPIVVKTNSFTTVAEFNIDHELILKIILYTTSINRHQYILMVIVVLGLRSVVSWSAGPGRRESGSLWHQRSWVLSFVTNQAKCRLLTPTQESALLRTITTYAGVRILILILTRITF